MKRLLVVMICALAITTAFAQPVPSNVETPAAQDNSTKAANTRWVQSLLAAQPQPLTTGNRTVAAWSADQINVKDKGALGNALGFIDGTISPNSNALSSNDATFSLSDVGKQITLTGSGTGGASQSGTITGETDAHHVTVSFTSVYPTPSYGLFSATVPAYSGTGGGYIPGTRGSPQSLLSLVGGGAIAPAVFLVRDTQVVAASIATAGTSGTPGACVLTGTTGTLRAGTAGMFQINATLSAGGAVSSLGSIVTHADYTTNPTTLAAEPVTGCGLTGASLSIIMWPLVITPQTMGFYPSQPAGPLATTDSAGGTGATVTPAGSTPTGGIYNYGTDDSAAFAAAITQANATFAAGKQAVIRVPGGGYYLKANVLPLFVGPGRIVGDAHLTSNIFVDPTYCNTGNTPTDLFSWSQAWYGNPGGSYPVGGASVPTSQQTAGPVVTDISVFGDRTSACNQTAMNFYDQDEAIFVDDVDVYYMRGSALCMGCYAKTATKTYVQESKISRVRFFNDGDVGYPVFGIEAIGGGEIDDLRLNSIDIYASYGTGILMQASAGSSIANVYFSQVRVEGLEWNIGNVAADNITVGGSANYGTISEVYFDELQLVDPYDGQAALEVNSAGNSPYDVYVSNGTITGGVPYGFGLRVDAGRSMRFQFANIFTYNTNVVVGPSPATAGYITLAGNGNEAQWTYSIDPTASAYFRRPLEVNGNPSLVGTTTGNQVGPGAFAAMVSGALYDTGFGNLSGNACTTCTSTTVFGDKAGLSITTGAADTAMGAFAGQNAKTTSNLTAVGASAAVGIASVPLTGNNDTAIGSAALLALQGAAASDTALGSYACQAATTATSILCLGSSVGPANVTSGTHVFLAGTYNTIDAPNSTTSYFLNVENIWTATATNTPASSVSSFAGFLNSVAGFEAGGTVGLTCAGTPSASFASKFGIVTHC